MPDENNAAGRTLFAQGHFPEAVEKFRAALVATPDDPNALNDLGAALVNDGKSAEAIKHFRLAAAKQTDPHERARALRNIAVVLRDKNRLSVAEKLARQAIDDWPDMAAAHRTLGSILRRLERPDDAVVEFRKAVDLDPNDPAKHNDLGLALVAANQRDAAIPHYEKASVLWRTAGSQDRKLALRNWADALTALGQKPQAVAKLREAVAADPRDANSHNSLGLALFAQNEFEPAAASYQEASRLWQGTSNAKFALRNWADALTAQGNKAQAVARLRDAVAADPADPSSYNSLGLALAAQNEFAAAIENYAKASELWQGSVNLKFALRNWGDAWFAQDAIGDAVAQYRAAIGADDTDPNSYNSLGVALARLSEFDQAIEQFAKAVGKYPKENLTEDQRDGCANVLCNWGDALFNLERYDEAIDRLGQATQLAPNKPDARFGYGNVLAEGGRLAEAIEQYDKAIEYDPDDPYSYHNKADQQFRLGRYRAGWDTWEQARIRFKTAFDAARQRPPAELGLLDAQRAAYFGYMLTQIFGEYDAAQRAFEFAVSIRPGYRLALCGRALLYRRWADSEDATQEIRIRAAQAMREACDAMQPSADLKDPRRYYDLIVLANLHIASGDFAAAHECLDQADGATRGSLLRRADIAVRRGVICLGTEEYEEAVRYFRQAMLHRGHDFDLQTRLGHALLRAKEYDEARRVFRRVIDVAPGHIEALIGCAVACIALGDDGDTDQYERAERNLTDAVLHGRDRRSGSIRLRRHRLAEVLYLRGYARVKRWEAGAGRLPAGLLQQALADFRQSRQKNPGHDRAAAAIDKIGDRGLRRIEESLTNRVGPLVLFAAGLFVFALALTLGIAQSKSTDPANIAMMFGGLAFAMAGLSLPTLLKLKVAGIELQKAAPEQSAPAGVVGLGRFDTGEALAPPTSPNTYPGERVGQQAERVPQDKVTTQPA